MARIRSIKPEFHKDYRLAKDLNRDQRLFYTGLWTESDDSGRFLAHPRLLLGAIFPYEEDLDDTFVSDLLDLLVRTGRLILYEIGGEPYGQLTKFGKHQTIQKPSNSRIPAPPKDLPSGAVDDSGSPTIVGTVGVFPTNSNVKEQGTGKGNREQGLTDTSGLAPDGASSNGGERSNPVNDVRSVFEYWRQSTGRDSRTQLTDRRRKIILTRLKRFTVSDLCHAIRGVMASDFHAAKPEYTDLTSCFKSDERVEQHIERATGPPMSDADRKLLRKRKQIDNVDLDRGVW